MQAMEKRLVVAERGSVEMQAQLQLPTVSLLPPPAAACLPHPPVPPLATPLTLGPLTLAPV